MKISTSKPQCHDCVVPTSGLDTVLCGLPGGQLDQLLRARTSHFFRRGQTLFFEGGACTGAHCVRSGLVKVSKAAPRDRQYLLHLAGPGEMVGLESILSGDSYQTSAEVIEDGVVCHIAREPLLRIIEENPRLMRRILTLVTRQLLASEDERSELSSSDVRQRVALTLLRLARKYGAKDGEGILISLNLTRQDLAAMVGSTPETAIRQLSDLREKGVIATNGRVIRIRDTMRLRRIARPSLLSF